MKSMAKHFAMVYVGDVGGTVAMGYSVKNLRHFLNPCVLNGIGEHFFVIVEIALCG